MAETLVRDLNIVIIQTLDLDAARAFYGQTLGLVVENETPNFLFIHTADGEGAALGVRMGEPSAGGPQVWFRVADTDALHTALVAQGVRIIAEPKDEPFGRSIAFADPGGNTIYAYQPPR